MNYELMVVAHPKEDPSSLVGKLEKFIKDASAQEIKVEKMGKKTLAYPIAKQLEAEYFLFNFEAPAEAISQISQNLRLERDVILRYLFTKISKVTKVTKVTKGTEGIKEIKGAEGSKAEEKTKVVVEAIAKSATKETKGTKELKSTKSTKSTKGTRRKKVKT